MSNAASSIVQRRLHEAQKYVLKMAGKLDDRQLRLLASPTSPSILFHIWHLGRWADRVQSTVPGLTPALGAKLPAGKEIWDTDGVGASWGFDDAILGNGRTGSGMTDRTMPIAASVRRQAVMTADAPNRAATSGAGTATRPMQMTGTVTSSPPSAYEIPRSPRISGRRGPIARS